MTKVNIAAIQQVGWHMLSVDTCMSITCSRIIHMPVE